ncbi:outer membrane beta-barrel protein [Pseudanabaena sp. PCC 6802]|uniref:outer membrane beta-barrel protein n=1 Tax=Pseudanabaena sp. PCC 6802 TaxID=118173 RepID=UPI000348B083|nr:outer membrane beta-barrel protein [Pseudanabaena sp. PCC 6802]
MKNLAKYGLTSAFVLTIAALVSLPAKADEARIPSSYLGAGVSLGGINSDTSSRLGGNITGRYKFEEVPVSFRTSVLLGNGGTSIVPTFSYDVPLGNRTNVYLGAGASVVPSNNSNSLTGDRNAFALQPGIEVSLNKNVLLYSNAVVAINGYNDGRTATSVQGGVGFQF